MSLDGDIAGLRFRLEEARAIWLSPWQQTSLNIRAIPSNRTKGISPQRKRKQVLNMCLLRRYHPSAPLMVT